MSLTFGIQPSILSLVHRQGLNAGCDGEPPPSSSCQLVRHPHPILNPSGGAHLDLPAAGMPRREVVQYGRHASALLHTVCSLPCISAPAKIISRLRVYPKINPLGAGCQEEEEIAFSALCYN